MSLFWRIFTLVYLTFAVLVGSLSWYLTRQAASQERRQIADTTRTAGSLLSQEMKLAAIDGTWPLSSLRTIARGDRFEFWWLSDENDRIFLANDPRFVGSSPTALLNNLALSSQEGSIQLDHSRELCLFSRDFGTRTDTYTFWLGCSLESVHTTRVTTIRQTALVSLFALLGFGVTLAWILKRFMAPIASLGRGFNELAEGNFDIKLETSSDDEMGRLVQAFNHTTRRLRESSEALAESSDQYHAIVESFTDGLILLTADHRVVLTNTQFQTWALESGLDPVAEGASLPSSYPFFAPVLSPSATTETNAPNEPTTREQTIEAVGRTLTVIHRPLPSSHRQRPRLFLCLIRDITEQRKIDNEIQKLQKLESVGSLAAGIAHDFNNQLSAILGSLSILSRIASSEAHDRSEVTRLVEELESHTKRAAGLAKRLITFSSGGQPQLEAHPLGTIVSNAIRPVLSDSDISFTATIPSELRPVIADADQLSEVIQNIALNARQAMNHHGKLELVASNVVVSEMDPVLRLTPGDYVRIRITDTGPGISPDVLSRIFDPFFSTKSSGHGIGLAAAHSIMERHSGRLLAASPPAKGAEFTLWLPAAAESLEPTVVESTQLTDSAGTILFVDDEAPLRSVFGRMAKLIGHDVVTAADHHAALDAYRSAMTLKKPFALVFLDLTGVDGPSGEETCRAIRNLNPAQTIIAMSGYADRVDIEELHEIGFADFLAKPFGLDSLEQVIHKWHQTNRH